MLSEVLRKNYLYGLDIFYQRGKVGRCLSSHNMELPNQNVKGKKNMKLEILQKSPRVVIKMLCSGQVVVGHTVDPSSHEAEPGRSL